MPPSQASWSSLRRGLIVIALLAALACISVSPAKGDVGVERVSRLAGAPGDSVRLTLGCGFCFPPCVGEPGHRHPPGGPHGFCMLGTRAKPPAAFPVWLTPLRHSLASYRCGSDDACAPGSSRPPHLPSFIYLGRAVRALGPDPAGRGGIPRYRLRFQVPSVPPGRYKYVIFCDVCVAGPRGSLIDSRTISAGRLRVRLSDSSGGAGLGGSDSGPWIAAGAIAAGILALVGGFLVQRYRVRGAEIGPRSSG